MSHITNCLKCGKCYEETSGEEANSPRRRCLACWDAERKRLGTPDIICPQRFREQCPTCRIWFRDSLHADTHYCASSMPKG